MQALERVGSFIVFGFIATVSYGVQKPNAVFDVASVRMGDPNSVRQGIHIQPGGRFNTTNTTLKMLVAFAYDVENYQIAGGPAWSESDKFTIDAKPVDPALIPSGPEGDAQIRLMVRSLLAERFKVSVHRDTKEDRIYNLVIGKNGSKLNETNPATVGQNLEGRTGQFTATGVPLSMLTQSLSRQLGRPVIDKTGLSGRYDFKLTYVPESRDGIFGQVLPTDPAAADNLETTALFTALQEQLGLKLESAKGPIEIVVIDQAERPTEN